MMRRFWKWDRLDGDFVEKMPCVGRMWMGTLQRKFLDTVCFLMGHNLWRANGSVFPPDKDHSLPVRASFCRRCYKGGYVRGDYV